jgi:hypothetical protein
MASLFGFGSTPVEIDIHLQGEDARRHVELKPSPTTGAAAEKASSGEGKKESCPVYYDAESVQGNVVVRVKDGKKLVHEGIRLELVGAIGESAIDESRSGAERATPSEARRKPFPSGARRKCLPSEASSNVSCLPSAASMPSPSAS